ncbi:MAG: radical SAM protein [Verrucomicrobiota bacterium]
MKVLLANPVYRKPLGNGRETFTIRSGSGWPHTYEQPVGQPAGYLPFPLYLAHAAAVLEKEPGVEVLVRDSIALNEYDRDFQEFCRAEKPDLILWEPATVTINDDIRLAQDLKKLLPGVKIVFAGFHVTGLTRETHELAGDCVDFYLLGEFEMNLLSLVRALTGGTPLETVPGLARQEGSKLLVNNTIKAMDFGSMPWAARHLFPTNKAPNPTIYWDGFISKKPAAMMHASRGCAYKCDFCAEIALIELKYRMRSPKDICDEIEHLVERYGIREVYFDDNIFTASRKQVLGICEEMIRRNLHRRTNWSAMVAFMGPTDEELLTKMAEAGCIGVKFGIDSADAGVLDEIGKPLDLERVKRLCKHCNRLGMKVHATLAMGHFRDTKETLRKSLDYAKELDCDTIQFSIVTPFPGTPLFDKLVKAGRLKSTDWRHFDGLQESVIIFPDMDAAYVANLSHKAMQEWTRHKLRDPRWVTRQFRFFFRSIFTNPSLLPLRAKQVWAALIPAPAA